MRERLAAGARPYSPRALQGQDRDRAFALRLPAKRERKRKRKREVREKAEGMNQLPPDELEAFALKRYKLMQHRLRPRYTKDGRCYRPGLPLDFSVGQFTGWLSRVFRQGIAQCAYCDWPISFETAHFDHRTPISRGGELSLDNLVPCCEACNQLKGGLSESAFLELKVFLAGLPPEDATDIRGRLQSQLKLALWKQARVKALKVQIVPHRHGPANHNA